MKSLTFLFAFILILFVNFDVSSQNFVELTLETDCYGGEVSWELLDDNQNIIAFAAQGTITSQDTIISTYQLPNGCYTFQIHDSYGDGMSWASCAIEGNYFILDTIGNVLVQMETASYGFGVSHQFTLPFNSTNEGCTDINAINFSNCASIDDGSCEYPPLTAQFTFQGQDCAPAAYTFQNQSTGLVENLTWIFPGGTPAISTAQNPTVTFDTPGTIDVSLIVSNTLGASDTLSQEITITDGTQIQVIINPDNYPGEISWDLVSPGGITVASGGSVGMSTCLEDSCYLFTIYDSYGDGICCTGSYYLVLAGDTIATGSQYAFQESVSINCPPGSDCNNPLIASMGENVAPYPNSWFAFTPDSSGQYEISTCNLTACNSEIWMYDYCNMNNFDDSNEATLTWNDQFCGDQAQITPLLEAGFTYYLRIGDQNMSCGADSLLFNIAFLGGIPGCMDSTACNYLPIAVEPEACYYDGDIQCQSFGPDLDVLEDVFYNSMFFTTLNNDDACYVNEGCMQGYGMREIIRFTTHIKNIGNEDYFIGAPAAQPDQFEWDACHNHWHYEGYAEYVLYDSSGIEMPQIGFKNGFCVLDLECSDGGTAKYTCGNMGISAGCGDIYSSGLSCQWIDVTDVPGGSYILVIRTNWDQSPDANGSYELSYDNNWGAVCITFDRDINGNLINFTKSTDCGIPLDCFGTPFGDAQPDCAGNCPGIFATGDLDNSGSLDLNDVDQYVSDVLGNDGLAIPCVDLDNDGNVTVTDAALAAGCIYYGVDHVDEFGVHDHCVWNDEIINPNHMVTLSIGEVNLDSGYFDVMVLNPDCRVVGYEFNISGASIANVQNMIDTADYNITPDYALGGYKIVGLSLSDQSVPKNLSPTPLLRIHYFALDELQICVDYITDIVNDDYQNTETTIGNCVDLTTVQFAEFDASRTTVCQGSSINFFDESLSDILAWEWSFEGAAPASSLLQHPNTITYNDTGWFNVTLTVDNGLTISTEFKENFIHVVDPSTLVYEDFDGDGFGNPLNASLICDAPLDFVLNNSDCNDNNNLIYPGATGTEQNIDNDCNGIIEGTEIDPSCPADFNNDQLINATDLLGFLSGFGCLSNCAYDVNGDDKADTNDMLIVLGAMGTTCP